MKFATVSLMLAVCAIASMASPCKVSIIGAGPSGLYTAFRLINSSKYPAHHVCVFEMSDHPGGRTVSVGINTLSQTNNFPHKIHPGAHGWKPLHHKVTDAIVNSVLGLHSSCRSRNQTKETCYDIGDSYYYLRSKYLKKINTESCKLPYNIRSNEENDGEEPNPILEAVLMYPPILEAIEDLYSFDPAVRYPAQQAALEGVRTYKINGKY